MMNQQEFIFLGPVGPGWSLCRSFPASRNFLSGEWGLFREIHKSPKCYWPVVGSGWQEKIAAGWGEEFFVTPWWPAKATEPLKHAI